MRECVFPACGRRSPYADGLCGSHRRQREAGHALRPIRKRGTEWEPDSDGLSAWIILRGIRGGERARARVDLDDLGRVLGFTWYAHKMRAGFYAARNPDGLHMHRLLLGAPPTVEVDHRNADGLDNRRENLRLAARSENAQNFARSGRETLRNISFDKARGKWLVTIRPRGRTIHGGRFDNLADAKRRAAELRAMLFPFANEARHE